MLRAQKNLICGASCPEILVGNCLRRAATSPRTFARDTHVENSLRNVRVRHDRRRRPREDRGQVQPRPQLQGAQREGYVQVAAPDDGDTPAATKTPEYILLPTPHDLPTDAPS